MDDAVCDVLDDIAGQLTVGLVIVFGDDGRTFRPGFIVRLPSGVGVVGVVSVGVSGVLSGVAGRCNKRRTAAFLAVLHRPTRTLSNPIKSKSIKYQFNQIQSNSIISQHIFIIHLIQINNINILN